MNETKLQSLEARLNDSLEPSKEVAKDAIRYASELEIENKKLKEEKNLFEKLEGEAADDRDLAIQWFVEEKEKNEQCRKKNEQLQKVLSREWGTILGCRNCGGRDNDHTQECLLYGYERTGD